MHIVEKLNHQIDSLFNEIEILKDENCKQPTTQLSIQYRCVRCAIHISSSPPPAIGGLVRKCGAGLAGCPQANETGCRRQWL
jgi:hypothetical protein